MTRPSLEPRDFVAFFEAVNGEPGREVKPFPWQKRLAETVFSSGWPHALDVPTGAGKTAAIDIAVFHLALEAGQTKRSAPVRILFVVDRRIVVDAAHQRAERIAKRLAEATEGVLKRVADRLRLLAEDDAFPLVTARLRGGAPRDPDWVRTPTQPCVVTSTVDQVGSRLFFRGYGVTNRMKPIHAGLLGVDSLFLLDEAHLSQPFVQSVRDASDYQRAPWCHEHASHPPRVVTLSATQHEQSPDLVRDDDLADPVLGPRLTRSKPVELVAASNASDSGAFAASFVDAALDMSALGTGDAAIVAVVVNRVRRARQIFEALKTRVDDPETSLALLIGRARPLERDERLKDLLPRMSAGRSGDGTEPPLIVVATQCLEAGADLDFDALVTELAPLDSLRQRFGRLNRFGRDITVRGVVLAAKDQISARAKSDPIYETSMVETWRLFEERGSRAGSGKKATVSLDFASVPSKAWLPDREQIEKYLSPKPEAPVMLPAFIEQWVCTSPIPAADPEVSLFLHGPSSGPADVQLVWRADLDPVDATSWKEQVRICPPSALEAVAVPIHELRRWLADEVADDMADVELAPKREDRDEPRSEKPVLRWRGADDDNTKPVVAREIRPGDLLVVPATRGGCDEWGWHPGAGGDVPDLGDRSNRQHRDHAILRLSPRLLRAELRRTGADEVTAEAQAKAFQRLLDGLAEEPNSTFVEGVLTSPQLPPEWIVGHDPRRARIERVGRRRLAIVTRLFDSDARRRRRRSADPVTEDESSSLGNPLGLGVHSREVRDKAREFAAKSGKSERITGAVALAAYLHDAGKAHRAFQLWLHGGDELALAVAKEPLAKSETLRLDKAARERSGLPGQARHEIASLAFAEAHPLLSDSQDRDLVLWLIGTHHGFGRPFFPPEAWPSIDAEFRADLGDGSVTVKGCRSLDDLTAEWLDRQSRLLREHGPWGLAHLEAIVRLADHRCSQSTQEHQR
jgi:CRISPR-associated endonuclease/helicase Cas3